MECNCSHRAEPDVFKHDLACALLQDQVRRFRDEGLPILLESVQRLEKIGEELARLPVHGDTNHRVANIRHTLLGEAFRLRATAKGMFLRGRSRGHDAESEQA